MNTQERLRSFVGFLEGRLREVWFELMRLRATTFASVIALCTFVLFSLPVQGLKAKAQTHPELTSHLACGCRNSKHESNPYDFYVQAKVTRTSSAWEYQYSFQNAEARETRFLVYVSENNNVEFVTTFITDTSKRPDSEQGQGPIIVTIPAHESRQFTVIDTSPPVEVVGHIRVLDAYDSIYGGGTMSLYFPRWERLFQ